ncbi:MAG: putative AAA+ superfamily ATPase [Candidatus Latescibacterota bacterium]|jgi:predicted AAA+ superfamily ATPase
MKRDLYKDLLDWKASLRRKPLLLQGARQTGKTYLLKAFGHNEYARLFYFNFEEDPGLDRFFERDLNPTRILSELSIYSRQDINPASDLVVFDEIQVSNRALNALKYFQEKTPDYHIAVAGSMLGVKLSTPGSFPVGKVNFLKLYPLTFLEFLDAAGESRYRQVLEEIEVFSPLPGPFHDDLVALLRTYYFIGGMPEAVHHFVRSANHQEVRDIQQEIINSYVLDFVKHAPTVDMPKLSLIWDSIPGHLARENKKFVFSAVRTGARAREYESALSWLEDTGLIYRVSAVENSKHPLTYYADRSIFKIYMLDVGLLGAMAKVPVDILAQGARLFNEYEGAFVENYVAQQLIAAGQEKLFYWRSKGGKAELDFLCEIGEGIVPLEVKAGVNLRSKSLASYEDQFAPSCLARTTLLNLKQDGKICNLPLYAVSLLSSLIANTTDHQ